MLFLTMRVFHVVLAAAWFGAVAFITLYLSPSVTEAGAGGNQLMAILMRRGLHKYMASIGGLTVLTGVYLFWHFMVGFGPGAGASHAGMAFSVGALTGVIALILGGAIVGASAKKLADLGPRLASTPEGTGRTGLMQEAERLRGRMDTFGRIVLALLFFSLAAMALGHYV
jgi:hypothetical protein